jgi:hypothetical protein
MSAGAAPLPAAACNCIVKLAVLSLSALHNLQLLVHVLVPAYFPLTLKSVTLEKRILYIPKHSKAEDAKRG